MNINFYPVDLLLFLLAFAGSYLVLVLAMSYRLQLAWRREQQWREEAQRTLEGLKVANDVIDRLTRENARLRQRH